MATTKFQLKGDASGAVSAWEEVARATRKNNQLLDKQGKTLKRLDSGSRQFLRNLKEQMLRIPLKAFAKGWQLIGRSIREGVMLMRQMKAEAMQLAREGERASRRLDTALRANVGNARAYRAQLDAFNRGISKQSGTPQAELQEIQSKFAPQLKNSGPQAVTDLIDLTRLTLNLSAQTGRSIQETSDALAELVAKGEFESLAKFGLNRNDVDALKAKKAAGDLTFVVDALRKLDARSQGQAAAEGAANRGSVFRNEGLELLEKFGALAVEFENRFLEPLIGPIQGINDALTGADLGATARNAVELFQGGGFDDLIERLKKEAWSPLIEGLKETGMGFVRLIFETIREGGRFLGVNIENGVRRAFGFQENTSEVERVQQLDGTFRETRFDPRAFQTGAIERAVGQVFGGVGQVSAGVQAAATTGLEVAEQVAERSAVSAEAAEQRAERAELMRIQQVARPAPGYL